MTRLRLSILAVLFSLAVSGVSTALADNPNGSHQNGICQNNNPGCVKNHGYTPPPPPPK